VTTVFLDHPLLLSLGLFVLLTATVEAGFRLAVLTSPNIDEERREQIAASRGALGISAQLAARLYSCDGFASFRFAQTTGNGRSERNWNHKSSRRCLAGSTAKPGPHATTFICSGKAGVFAGRSWRVTADGRNRTHQALQSSLWQQAEESARQSPTPITALFVASVNDTIDLSEKRLTALENRVPRTIWLMLLLIALLTCLILADRRRIAPHDRDRHGTDR